MMRVGDFGWGRRVGALGVDLGLGLMGAEREGTVVRPCW